MIEHTIVICTSNRPEEVHEFADTGLKVRIVYEANPGLAHAGNRAA